MDKKGVDMANFQITGINHIGLAPKDPQKASDFFKILLNLPHIGEELVAEQRTNTIMFESSNINSAEQGSRLELLIPTDSESVIQKFLDKKGSGIHHLALSVKNLHGAIAHLEANGVQMIDKVPRRGAHHSLIAFVHPASVGGLLIELVEPQTDS